MPNNQLPTLEDVAQLAGVSTATVSRCLNSPDQVVEKTRTRVMQAVDKLGYVPNFGAKALAAKRSNTIGAVIPTMENAIFAKGLQAFQERLSAENFDLLVASSSYQRDQEEQQIRSLVARGAEGILLIGTERDDQVYELLNERQIPYVVAWSFHPEFKGQCDDHFVGFDNKAAMGELARRIVDLGHTNIAMIAGQKTNNDRAKDRIEGVKSGLNECGIDTNAIAIIESEYNFDAARAAFSNLMNRDNRPTAIICGNDVLAVGALMQAKEMGIDVPKDVSITGFDDIEIAAVVEPGLTTIRVPHRAMGEAAAISLLDQILRAAPPLSHQLNTKLIERGSLAAIVAD